MRLWSLHPLHLDRQGLLAAWREGLLAQSVIVKLQNGEKPGYRNHPQLTRFLASESPLCFIGTWLTFVHENASERGYTFNKGKILKPGKLFRLFVTSGQIEFEREHLLQKLQLRAPKYHANLINIDAQPHPMFYIVDGDPEDWEKWEMIDCC